MIKVEHFFNDDWLTKRVYFFGLLIYQRSVHVGIAYAAGCAGGSVFQVVASR